MACAFLHSLDRRRHNVIFPHLHKNPVPGNLKIALTPYEISSDHSPAETFMCLLQELSEHLGIRLLNERLNDPTMQDSFESIFPRDNPRNTRFAINFFTSIGLGGITENLREYLKNMPRLIMQQQKEVSEEESGSGSDSDSDSGSESAKSESSSDRERRKKRRR